MRNFSFSHSVYERPVLQTHKNQGLFGKLSRNFEDTTDHKFRICMNAVKLSNRDLKHFGKRRKYWLPAFSAFPTMLSKAFFLGH